jgi:hypothetical protein
MGGGLLQLVAYGAQDVYLTGNPQITFFKVVYRRHTNFSIESILQTFNGNPELGGRATCQIARNGDLVHRLYLEMTVSAENSNVYLQPYYGYKIIKHIEIEIGGQRIDKQYGEWMYIWNELSLDRGKLKGYREMVGANTDDPKYANQITTAAEQKLYIPIEFWFCRNIGLALPLIALQYHEVKINIEFNKESDIKAYEGDKYDDSSSTIASGGNTGTAKLKDVKLWADYIFLDTDERKRFAQLSHEYLIEQLQFTGTEKVDDSTSKSVRLSFNHPCKELVWVVNPTFSSGTSYWNNFYHKTNNQPADITSNLISTTKLQLNGNDRFAERDGNYFSLVQPYQHHTNIPENGGINVYSFALKPEEHQPSGTLNMSRIDTAQLNVKSEAAGDLYVYAVNYNVLRILSGMGGLAYSN